MAFAFVALAVLFAVEDRAVPFACCLALGVLAKESVLFAAPLLYTFGAERPLDGRAARRALLAAAPALVALVAVRLAIPAWNGQPYALDLPAPIAANARTVPDYSFLAVARATLARRLDELPSTIVRTISAFGLLVGLLPFLGGRTAARLAARFAPFLVLVALQEVFAFNTERLLVLAFPAVIPLAVCGLRTLRDHGVSDAALLGTCGVFAGLQLLFPSEIAPAAALQFAVLGACAAWMWFEVRRAPSRGGDARVSDPEEPGDFRRSETGRRQSWHGLKRYVKGILGLRFPNWVLRRRGRGSARAPSVGTAAGAPSPEGGRGPRGRDRLRDAAPGPVRDRQGAVLGEGPPPSPRGRRSRSSCSRTWRADADVAVRHRGVHGDLHARRHEGESRGARARLRDRAGGGSGAPRQLRAERRDRTVSRPPSRGRGEPGGRSPCPRDAGGSALPGLLLHEAALREGYEGRSWSRWILVDVVPAGRRVLMKIDVEGTENEVLEPRHAGSSIVRSRHPVRDPRRRRRRRRGGAGARSARLPILPHPEHELVDRPAIVPDARFRDWLFTRRDAGRARRGHRYPDRSGLRPAADRGAAPAREPVAHDQPPEQSS